jgi:hypothetical protein
MRPGPPAGWIDQERLLAGLTKGRLGVFCSREAVFKAAQDLGLETRLLENREQPARVLFRHEDLIALLRELERQAWAARADQLKAAQATEEGALHERRWQRQLEWLKASRQKGAKAPKKLQLWLDRQRQLHRQSKLPSHRQRQLEEAAVPLSPPPAIWQRHIESLVRYSQIHGHAKVPWRWPEDPAFGYWCASQRSQQARGVLTAVKVEQLTALGFVWRGQKFARRDKVKAL